MKKPRSLEIARARSATRPNIDSNFTELGKIIDKYSLKDKPNYICNIDEKERSTEHKPPRIVTGSKYKAQAITGGKFKTTTVIGGGNGVGQQVPPFFLFFLSRGCKKDCLKELLLVFLVLCLSKGGQTPKFSSSICRRRI